MHPHPQLRPLHRHFLRHCFDLQSCFPDARNLWEVLRQGRAPVSQSCSSGRGSGALGVQSRKKLEFGTGALQEAQSLMYQALRLGAPLCVSGIYVERKAQAIGVRVQLSRGCGRKGKLLSSSEAERLPCLSQRPRCIPATSFQLCILFITNKMY